jgi:dipeptide transport system substrate-binding protein
MPIHGSYHALAKDKPLGNVKVRQALSLAINRQEIIDTLYYGFAQMPAPARSDFNREDMTDYLRGKWMPWSAKNYGYDLDKAKQLLKEAGWDKGFSFDLWAVPDSSAPNLPDLITAVAGYWEKIGAHANIINADAAGYTKIKNTRKSTEAVGAVGTGATDLFGSSILKMNKYTSDQTSENWLDFSPSIQEFDALYKEGMSCMDPKRREQIIDRMLELTTSSWTCIPLITAPLTFVIGPRVKADVSPVAVYLERQISSFKYSGKEPK